MTSSPHLSSVRAMALNVLILVMLAWLMARLTKLTHLRLNFAPITDDSAKELKGLTKLVDLNLKGTKVTPAGLQELRQALPNCKISN